LYQLVKQIFSNVKRKQTKYWQVVHV